MLIDSLKKIGLSEKDALVYLTLIRSGAQTASTIAKKTEINRTSTYDIIKSLTKRGFISSIKQDGVTHYKALDPREILNYLEREKKDYINKIEKEKKNIESVLPALISLENPTSTKPKVVLFEGDKGMRQAYEDTLKAEGEILAYANIEEMHKGLPLFFPDYYVRRGVNKKISIKCIAPDNKFAIDRHKKDKEESREMVLVDKKNYDFSPEINIYNDKVLIVSWIEKIAIQIQSKEIAEFFKVSYEMAWKAAKSGKFSNPKSS